MSLKWLIWVLVLGGCDADHRIGNNTTSDLGALPSPFPYTGLTLETYGKTFEVGCFQSVSTGGGASGCEGALGGYGSGFKTNTCPDAPAANFPGYGLQVGFRGFSPYTVSSEMTFDLSDATQRASISIELNYQNQVGTEYMYCSNAAGFAGYTPQYPSGTVVLRPIAHPTGIGILDIILIDVVLPTKDGPPFKIISAHSYI